MSLVVGKERIKPGQQRRLYQDENAAVWWIRLLHPYLPMTEP